jgi:hypothetical protein
VAPKKDDGFSQFDDLVALGVDDLLALHGASSSPWQSGSFAPSLDLLQRLLSIPISQGDKQESGRTAKGFDAWIAHELRRAGFPEDGVWPRNRRPRVSIEGIGGLEDAVEDLERQLLEWESATGSRLKPAKLRNAITSVSRHMPGHSSAYVLGDFYSKQIDVGLSSWKRGPDILISTKTMFSAYGKNLKNRHEEAVGEVLSLRRRHPMAAMGYAYLVREDILNEPNSYATLYDILSRLRRPGETFDATMLLVLRWDEHDLAAGITHIDQPAHDLTAAGFFTDIVEATLDRTPSKEHQPVRHLHGGMPVGGLDEEDEDEDLADG